MEVLYIATMNILQIKPITILLLTRQFQNLPYDLALWGSSNYNHRKNIYAFDPIHLQVIYLNSRRCKNFYGRNKHTYANTNTVWFILRITFLDLNLSWILVQSAF